MPKEKINRQTRAAGAFVRLTFAARALAWQALHSRTGEAAPACPWCQTGFKPGNQTGSRDEDWLRARHAPACPLGGVTRALAELAGALSIEEIAAMADDGAGPAESEPRPAGRPPGVPEGHVAPASGRKPPARVSGLAAGLVPALDTVEISPVAIAVLDAGLDFGEPWQASPIDPSMILDRAGREIHDGWGSALTADEDPVYSRRMAAAMNLCAGARTEALEQAFEQIASTTPRWALLAIDVQNLGAGQMAAIRDFIDMVVKDAAAPRATDYGRPQ